MQQRQVPLYICDICGSSSVDRADIERCEARGVPEPGPSVGSVGFLYRCEVENQGNFQQEVNWVVRVQVAESFVQGHVRMCKVFVDPDTSRKPLTWQDTALNHNGDINGEVLASEIFATHEAASTRLHFSYSYSS